MKALPGFHYHLLTTGLGGKTDRAIPFILGISSALLTAAATGWPMPGPECQQARKRFVGYQQKKAK
jgi:hypothetical protein